MVLGALRDRGGIIGTIAAAIGGAIWSLVTFLVVPVLALEGIGPIAAMKRSAALIRERWGQEITGNFIIGGLSGLITVIGIVVGACGVILFVAGATSLDMVAGGLLLVVGVFVTIGGAVFGGATRGVFGVALYHYAAEDQALGPFAAPRRNRPHQVAIGLAFICAHHRDPSRTARSQGAALGQIRARSTEAGRADPGPATPNMRPEYARVVITASSPKRQSVTLDIRTQQTDRNPH
jgi:hypothetical protein